MSDRLDNEQLKAKVGQILYNEFITGRLKEEVLAQFMQRGPIELSYSLGRDSNREEICINARIYRKPVQLESLKQEIARRDRTRSKKKYVIFAMSSEKPSATTDESLRDNFDSIMSQSLPWWDRYNMRGGVNIRDWVLERTIVAEGKSFVAAVKNALKAERFEKHKDAVSSLV